MNNPAFGGPWTEQKLDILEKYLEAYTTALKRQGFRLIYVDAFAGSGYYSEPNEDYREISGLRKGSATRALSIDNKPFDHFLFVEKDRELVKELEHLKHENPGRSIDVRCGDANKLIPEFCDGMGENDRAVVFLDPYAMELEWDTVKKVADTEKIDCWILFPLMAVSRVMPRVMPTGQEPKYWSKLDQIFGEREHWIKVYDTSKWKTMDGENQTTQTRPRGAEGLASLYRERLKSVFHKVAPNTLTLTNSRNAPLFALFFAASNPRGASVAIRIAHFLLNDKDPNTLELFPE